ncbi:hypothetical protein ACQY0O_000687 [Thecaphora frezii]
MTSLGPSPEFFMELFRDYQLGGAAAYTPQASSLPSMMPQMYGAHNTLSTLPPSASTSTTSFAPITTTSALDLEGGPSLPLSYANMLQTAMAGQSPLFNASLQHGLPRPSLTGSSPGFSESFDSWPSAINVDSGPLASSIKREPSIDYSLNNFAFTPPSSFPPPPFPASTPSWQNIGQLPSTLPLPSHMPVDPFDCSYTAPPNPPRSYSTGDFPQAPAPPPASWGLERVPEVGPIAGTWQDPLPADSTTGAQSVSGIGSQWTAGDSLSAWLDQDVLSDLLSDLKGEHPAPISETQDQDEAMAVDLQPLLCRRRRNAIVQLPLVVSCGVLSALVKGQAGDDDEDVAIACDDSFRDPADAEDQEDHGGHPDGALSPFSRPLSPMSCPLSPKSSQPLCKVLRSASCSAAIELPEMHRMLSSWSFSSQKTPRQRSSSGGVAKSSKRDKQDAVHDAAHRASKAISTSLKRAPRRAPSPRQSAAGETSGSDSDSGGQSDPVDDSAPATGLAAPRPSLTSKTKQRQSKGGKGKSCTVTDRIVLRPRPGTEDEEVPYPHLPDTFEAAKRNQGPPPCEGEQDSKDEVMDESANVFPSDLYAPRLTRRGPNGREGWCSLCPQGGWYSMKRSQYLYHLQYDHGVSSLTRKVFRPPLQLRVWNDAVEKTEGLCHHCNEWIAICFGPVRKRDWKAFFKHSHKCLPKF